MSKAENLGTGGLAIVVVASPIRNPESQGCRGKLPEVKIASFRPVEVL